MRKIILSLKTMFQIAYAIDKKSLFICIAYNLIKQLMNVFYGVYFIRMILVGLEAHSNIWYIVIVLTTMLVINTLFNKFDLYYHNIYLPNFRLQIDSYVNEMIFRKANTIPYDVFNSPDELDKYIRIMENSSEKIFRTYSAFGTMCGLIEAFIMIVYYVISVDVFAILLSVFPLLYSYFLSEKSEESKYELNKKISSYNRKKEYAKRVFSLRDYVKEVKTSRISDIIKGIYQEGSEQVERAHKTDGRKIFIISFIEMFLGDAISMVLPMLYLIIRMVYGAFYFMGDFIGIAQAITTFSSDVEWILDSAVDLKSASLYVCDYVDYIRVSNEQKVICPELNMINDFRITFENVKYQYPGEQNGKYAINDISVTIKSGEKIAIVGENGAGKTTFVSLMTNLITCSSGRILLNGVDIHSYDDLTSFFGVVLQDFQIYPISVRENIAVDGPVSDDDIMSAIREVGLHKKIHSPEINIGKELDSDGLELSGGECQKLALARVVANKSPFVILDEPTSALDAISERQINSLIIDALKDSGRTLLFISHKLSTTKLVDRILVFKNGKIVEDGNHEELIKNKGLYYRLYQEQRNMYKGAEL